jgi:hypothetical protein
MGSGNAARRKLGTEPESGSVTAIEDARALRSQRLLDRHDATLTKLTGARTFIIPQRPQEMINVDKILKVMRADLPANFDKEVLASELRKAKSWYQIRSKFDKLPKREKIIGRFIMDTESYRHALKAYSDACQDIPLPFKLPCWLNTEALDDVVIEAVACLPLYQNKAKREAAQKIRVEFGADRGSAMDFLLGLMLPKIFRKCFRIPPAVRNSMRDPDTPFVRFAVEAARQILNSKTGPRPQSVASSYRTMNVTGAGRRRASSPTVQN